MALWPTQQGTQGPREAVAQQEALAQQEDERHNAQEGCNDGGLTLPIAPRLPNDDDCESGIENCALGLSVVPCSHKDTSCALRTIAPWHCCLHAARMTMTSRFGIFGCPLLAHGRQWHLGIVGCTLIMQQQ